MNIVTDQNSRQRTVRIKRMDAAKRVVYGEVYAPYVLDTYGEFMKPEDIELLAHRYMQLQLSETIDTGHDNKPNGSYPVESFIAREGDPDYTAGAWVLGVKIPDDETWGKVERGELNGYSFEAMVLPVEEDIDYFVVRDHVGAVESAMDHEHAYFIQMSDDGRVRSGRTSPGPDGHVHTIIRGSVTEVAADHTHRFFL